MRYIKVWCEYDIGGRFGGNGTDDVFIVPDDLSKDDINEWVEHYVSVQLGEDVSKYGTSYGWDFISLEHIS